MEEVRMMSKLSRRDFLRMSAIAGAGAIVVACQPTPEETPAPAATEPTAPEATEPAAPPPEKKTGKFMFSTWGDYRFFEDGFKRMQEAYPEYGDITFENSQTETNEQLLQRLMTDMAAGSWDTMPDVCEMSTWAVPALQEAKVTVDLTDQLAPFAEDISPAVMEMLTHKGRQFAVPWMPNSAMVWYRKDVFDMAGVSEDDIETWDDFIAVGKKVTEFEYPDGVDRYMVSVPATWANMREIQVMLSQQGGGLFDPDTGETIIDTDANFKRAFERWTSVATEEIALRIDTWDAPWYQALSDGIIACFYSANWMDQIFQLEMPETEGKWRAMKIPAFESGGPRGGFWGGSANVVGISKPEQDSDLVWKYMESSFLSDTTGALTADWLLVPAYLPAFEHPYYKEPNEFHGGLLLGQLDKEVQEEANAFRFTKDYPEADALVGEQLQEAWAGEKSVDEAIADAAASIRESIGTSL